MLLYSEELAVLIVYIILNLTQSIVVWLLLYVESNCEVANKIDSYLILYSILDLRLYYSLRSRILNCDNSIVVCLNDCFLHQGCTWTSWQKSQLVTGSSLHNCADYLCVHIEPERFHNFSVVYAYDGNIWFNCVYFTMLYLCLYVYIYGLLP